MKLNLFSCAILLLLSVTILKAQENSLELYLYNNKSFRIIDNSFRYSLSPFSNTKAELRGLSLSETRLNFNQFTKLSNLELDLERRTGIFNHGILSGFSYHYDKNDLETDLNAFSSRTGFLGYALQVSPLDSLRLSVTGRGIMRKEQDRYLAATELKSDGYQLQSNLSYAYYGDSGFYGLSGNLDTKQMDWESYESIGFSGFLNQELSHAYFSTMLNINQRSDRLYALQQNTSPAVSSSYEETDLQRRSTLLSDSRLSYQARDNWDLLLSNSFLQRKTRLEENLSRNNADFQNIAALESAWRPIPNITHLLRVNHSYAIKDFSFSNSNRHTEFRQLGSNLYWQYAPGDSLYFGSAVDLQRTSYPNDENRLDNDLRNVNLQLGIRHYYKDRIRLSSRLLWNIKDDIYINSLLSANNNRVQSLSFFPEMSVLIGDRTMLKQSYQIRADYTDYMYSSDSQPNGLYRQFSARYNLIFDTFPFQARSGDSRWMLLPYRSSNPSAFLCDMLLAFERSEYGYEEIDRYIINSVTQRYTLGLTLRHDIAAFYYQIVPRLSLGTWKEYNLLASIAYNFNNYSLIEFSLNPIGEHLDSLDWRMNMLLKLLF